jgi:ABC-type antimicrobial peptide transport system permease subunit
MFSWKFVKGSAATAISNPSAVVLTESAAKAFFGDGDPINKVLKIDNDRSVEVSAVIADPPGNSTFQFDYIRPFNYSDPEVQERMSQWQGSAWSVFLQLEPGADINLLNKHINDVERLHSPEDKVSTYFTFPMSKWRLYSEFKDGKNIGGMIEYVRLFTIIALVILLIACVNFMNLSTARSEMRAKEVGIRKTLGSDRRQLVLQFFFESIILALIALFFSIVAVYLLLPGFNLLLDKHLSLNIGKPMFWLGALSIVLLTGVLAGSYPALYLSSFNPTKVLKGSVLAGKKAVLPRRILVVTQFVISILLISATIIVYQQIQHVKNRHIGYNPANLIMVPATPDMDKNYTVIKQELLKSGLVAAATRTSSPITQIWWRSPSPDYDGKPGNTNIIFSGMLADVDFTKTMGIAILEGKDFAGTPSDSSSMLLNKAAVEAMALRNPIGMQMRLGKIFTVIGVTDNVVMDSPFKPVDPLMVLYNKDNSSYVSLRFNPGVQPQQGLQAIEKIFTKYNPAFPFEYQFADEEFGKKFITEVLISKLTNIFAGLAIFICCIGLAGLASFTIEKRLREIGIRKILGATVQQLLMLISKEFLKLVIIAFAIAVPITWLLMDNWLQKYDYHVTISLWMFGLVGLVILLLTLAVVGLNTAGAAIRNPIKSLRTE